MRGYSLKEAFQNSSPAVAPPAGGGEPVAEQDGIKMKIDNAFGRTLVERTDSRGDIAYGIRHTPGAHMKVFNASKAADASMAFSFVPASDAYDDVIKIVKKPSGGYELHLQKINTLVIDGKRVDTTSLSKWL